MTFTAGTPAAPAVPSRGRLRPLGQGEVRITDGFWADRQRVNADATLPHIGHWLEREGWSGNFDLAVSGGLPEGRRGREFSDSEVYKFLEALAWEIGRSGDDALEARFRALVARVAAAQEPDGYLNTVFGRPGQPPRWSDLEWGHELYCYGHLFQAAVARARTRPGADDGLLEVARRAADLVCDVFGPGGIESVCGHAVIEPGLAELARVTGEDRYLEQAALFVERRGHGVLKDVEWGRAYFQDDVPVRKATVLRGHVVRAGYLSAGAVDIAVERQDDELLGALATQWGNTVARRTYVTGGQGSHHQDESFGDDWVLPPDRAYSETCASVGSVMFSWRLLLAEGLPRYADLIERTLYNVVATSPSREGTSFYYANTLHQRRAGVRAPEDSVSPRAVSSLRSPWFEVSCCPPNVARTLASLAAYVATVDDEGLQLHQYAGARIRTALADGRPLEVDVETAYPRDGVVRVLVRADAETPWTLTLRVPSWATGSRLVLRPAPGSAPESAAPPGSVSESVAASGRASESVVAPGRASESVVAPGMASESGTALGTASESEEESGTATDSPAAPGTVSLRRAFRAGDVVELHLPMAPRVSAADPRIDAVRGCLVVERGPEVLCLESVDLAAATGGRIDDVADVLFDASTPPVEVDGEVRVRMRRAVRPADDPWPYRPVEDGASMDGDRSVDGSGSMGSGPSIDSSPSMEGARPTEAFDVTLVRYNDWAERGPSTMRVWLPATAG